ncbi:MAG: efflux RND transporter periplasmic adaptor subunit [Desulfobulbaceae bacterium]|nr:efflux RND transporter periplasmic adaptor subunit [Desulfobulbaceae bacterium]
MQPDNITPQTRRGRIVKQLMQNLPRLLLLALIIMIIALSMAVKKKNARLTTEKAAALSKERPSVNAVLLEVAPGVIHDRINLPGEIEPWTRLEMLARISGTVEEVLVIEGRNVKEGEVLARIEAADYRIALDAARANFDLARVTIERIKNLYGQGIIPIADLDKAENELRTARAAMEDATLNLSRCSITAPMSGVIRRLDLKKGLMLSVGDPMAELLKIDQVKAVIGIPESDVAAVRGLDTVEFTIQALDDRRITGRKFFLSPSPENQARLYRLELAVDNPRGEILPGMFLRANIVKKTVEQAIIVPLYAVLTRNDEHYVFVEKDGIAEKRLVTLGIMEEWQAQVTKGLEAGERVIIEGHRDVEAGQQVNTIRLLTDVGALR